MNRMIDLSDCAWLMHKKKTVTELRDNNIIIIELSSPGVGLFRD